MEEATELPVLAGFAPICQRWTKKRNFEWYAPEYNGTRRLSRERSALVAGTGGSEEYARGARAPRLGRAGRVPQQLLWPLHFRRYPLDRRKLGHPAPRYDSARGSAAQRGYGRGPTPASGIPLDQLRVGWPGGPRVSRLEPGAPHPRSLD